MRDTSSMVMTTRPRWRVPADEPHGVTAVLLAGDPDAAWDYVERQVADLAAKHDVPVEEVSHGSGELLWVEMPDPRERLTENLEEAIGDADLEEAGRLDGTSGGMHGRRASRPAGQATSSSRARARLTSQRSSTLSTEQPVHSPIPRKRRLPPSCQVERCRSPTSTVRRSWMPWARRLCKLQAMMPQSDEAAWQTHSGLAISAVEPGFRLDAITVPGESGTLGAGRHRQ